MLGSLTFRLAHGLKVWPWRESFLMAWDCVKCLEIRGFVSWQAYLINLFLSYWQILLAIFPPCPRLHVSPAMVASNPTLNNNGTNAKN